MITRQEATKKMQTQEFWMTRPSVETIQEYIKAGIDPNMTAYHKDYSYAKYPILTMAAQYVPDAIPLLIKAGADVNQPDYQGETPVEAASYWSAIKPKALKYLLTAGGDFKKETDTSMGCANPEGQAVLDQLKSSIGFFLPSPGRLNCLGWLLSEGANMYDDPDDKVAEETRQKMKMLFEAGINPDAPARYNQAPIFSTTCNGYLKATQIILDCGGNPNVCNREGNTPLIEMGKSMAEYFENGWRSASEIYRENAEMIKLLVRYGADVTLQNPKGESFLSLTDSMPYIRDLVQAFMPNTPRKVASSQKMKISKSKIDEYQKS